MASTGLQESREWMYKRHRINDYYRDEFEKMASSSVSAPLYSGKWNWVAFFWPEIWALYHRLFMSLILFLVPGLVVLGISVLVPEDIYATPYVGIYVTSYLIGLVCRIIIGACGNYMLYCKVRGQSPTSWLLNPVRGWLRK